MPEGEGHGLHGGGQQQQAGAEGVVSGDTNAGDGVHGGVQRRGEARECQPSGPIAVAFAERQCNQFWTSECARDGQDDSEHDRQAREQSRACAWAAAGEFWQDHGGHGGAQQCDRTGQDADTRVQASVEGGQEGFGGEQVTLRQRRLCQLVDAGVLCGLSIISCKLEPVQCRTARNEAQRQQHRGEQSQHGGLESSEMPECKCQDNFQAVLEQPVHGKRTELAFALQQAAPESQQSVSGHQCGQ